MQLRHEASPALGVAVDVAFGEAIDTGRVTARIAQHRVSTRAEPSRLTHEARETLMALCWLRQRPSRKLFLDFQDLCRVHGAPFLLLSCCRMGSLRPVRGVPVSFAGRDARDYY